jgi:hypothetical protein
MRADTDHRAYALQVPRERRGIVIGLLDEEEPAIEIIELGLNLHREATCCVWRLRSALAETTIYKIGICSSERDYTDTSPKGMAEGLATLIRSDA